MFLRAAPLLLLLGVAASPLPGLQDADARPLARPAAPFPDGLFAWVQQPGAERFTWTQGAASFTATCRVACEVGLPRAPTGVDTLWLTFDGTRTARLAAAVIGGEGLMAGVPGFDVVRLPVQAGDMTALVTGSGAFTLQWGAPADRELPNLVALAPAHLGRPLPGAPASGCLREELDLGAVRCLRFSTGVANDGKATFELAGPGGDVEDVAALWQSLSSGAHVAGNASYHATHAHFHYADFVAFDLHAVDAATGLRGDVVLRQGKTGFCMVDWALLAGAADAPAKRFWRHGCDPGQATLSMGVQPGWYDLYRWFLPEQFLDMAAVPSGLYELVVTVDPAGLVRQTERFDDRAALRFTWSDGRASVTDSWGFYAA